MGNMRLLSTETWEFRYVPDPESRPAYVAVSRRWRHGQVTYSDLVHRREDTLSSDDFAFYVKAARAAQDVGIGYIWAFDLCVDSSSSAQLSEAIVCSYRWLSEAHHLIAYLDDLAPIDPDPPPYTFDEPAWRACSWFTRCWTLPELLAPPSVRFHDRTWTFRGCKTTPPLRELISRITDIPTAALADASLVRHFSVAKRMSWAARRSCSREEDRAYSLVGIMDANIPVIYGEGATAFVRLQEEICRTSPDMSLFLWDACAGDPRPWRGAWASSPAEYWRWIGCPPSWHEPLLSKSDVVCSGRGLTIFGDFLYNPESSGNGLLVRLGSHHATPHRTAVMRLYRLGETFVRPAVGAAVTVRKDLDLKSSRMASKFLQLPRVPRPAVSGPTPSHVWPPSSCPSGQPEVPRDPALAAQEPLSHSDTSSSGSSATVSDDGGFSVDARSTMSEGFMEVVPRKKKKRANHVPQQLSRSQKRRKVEAQDPESRKAPPTPTSRTQEETVEEAEQVEQEMSDGTEPEPFGEKQEFDAALEDQSSESNEDDLVDDDDDDDDEIIRPPTLEPNHEFQKLVPELTQHSLLEFSTWKSDKQPFLARPDGTITTLPLRPRARRFACPVWLAAGGGDEAAGRAPSGSASPAPTSSPEQLDDAEHASSSAAVAGATEAGQWYAIWDVLFRGGTTTSSRPRPRSPYFGGGGAEEEEEEDEERDVCLQVALMRDFWREEGQAVVSGFLQARKLLSWCLPAEERTLSALYSLVQDRLADALYDESLYTLRVAPPFGWLCAYRCYHLP
ncbi:unnamed protein product [Parascedosporium putredinis]|uniref:DUF8212 domain-containing protein n=1 Tax=Parascedosporium putredinis TaxID=1442378 RepID=A0A9P1H9A8_9PEZI|nr:unnamed protein product [Parascedosporium putredinis]CAI8000058.1 unnamed protein product [Parascedosporium putredinis]